MTAAPVDWYAARAAGVVAYALLTGGVLLGTLLSGRVRLPRWPAFAVTDVHRFVGLLVGVFVSLHVLFVALDSYVRVSLVQLVVPGASSYRPLWVALGVVAAELLLAVAIANAVKRRIGFRRWRRVHYLTFVVWAGATVHGLGAGTDSGTVWLRLLYVASIASVLAAVAWRVGRSRRRGGPVLAPGAAAVLFGFVLVVGLGRLPSGLGAARPARAAVPLPGRVSDSLTGSVEQQQGPGGALVSVVGRAGGQRRLAYRIDVVTPDGRQITDTSLQVKDLASGALCTGTVGKVDSSGFTGSCSFPGGPACSVSGTWNLADRRVSGSLRLSA